MTAKGDGTKPTSLAATKPAETPSSDVIVVGGPSEDGKGVSIVRLREDRIEAGELRAPVEGQPIMGELVKLTPRADHERAFDVEVLARGPQAQRPSEERARGKGPAKISTDAYRSGWEQIFGTSEAAAPEGKNRLN